jgi:syntaxin 1B/2/3
MHRTRYRERIERQFKIGMCNGHLFQGTHSKRHFSVKPDATRDEVTTVVNDDEGGGNQIFAQAVNRKPSLSTMTLTFMSGSSRHLRDTKTAEPPIGRSKGAIKI